MIETSSLFPGAADNVYLNTAAMALGNVRARRASAIATDEWMSGKFDFAAAESLAEDLRSGVASLVGTSPDNMAIVTGASGAAGTVAAQLPATSKANVVVPERDYLSNFMAWTMLRHRGYELRFVEDAAGVLTTESFDELVDENTALIATSLVQSASGFRVDVDALKEVAGASSSWLVVDASQALGAIEVDVDGIDAFFGCSHKWLLGIRGMGHLYVKPELGEAFVPITPGWKSTADPVNSFYGPEFELAKRASKLDSSFGWFDAIANLEGLRIIEELGIGDIEAHNMSLVDHLENSGIEVQFARKNRSPIVSIKLKDPDTALARLHVRGITASLRSGSLRVSLHLYNTIEDVDTLVEALQ